MPNGWNPNTPFEGYMYQKLESIQTFIESIKIDCGNRLDQMIRNEKRITMLENDNDNLPCKDHGNRLSKLENRYVYLAGGCAGVIGLLGIAVAIYEKFFSK